MRKEKGEVPLPYVSGYRLEGASLGLRIFSRRDELDDGWGGSGIGRVKIFAEEGGEGGGHLGVDDEGCVVAFAQGRGVRADDGEPGVGGVGDFFAMVFPCDRGGTAAVVDGNEERGGAAVFGE